VKATLWTDGGARGNPGPAAYGYVLEAEDGTVLAAHGEAIGVATNNVAEYRALVGGLEKAPNGRGRARGRVDSSSSSRCARKVRTRTFAACSSKPRSCDRLGSVRYGRPADGRLADRLVNKRSTPVARRISLARWWAAPRDPCSRLVAWASNDYS
jgi:hypothetical protein